MASACTGEGSLQGPRSGSRGSVVMCCAGVGHDGWALGSPLHSYVQPKSSTALQSSGMTPNSSKADI